MEGWRTDFENAPKDGTDLLLWFDGVDDAFAFVGRYDDTDTALTGGDYGPFVWKGNEGSSFARDSVTHWCVLQPPVEA